MFLNRTPILSTFGAMAVLAGTVLSGAAPVHATSFYTSLDLDACTVVQRYEETGDVDLQCPGYKDLPVFVSDSDARMDIDYGVDNNEYESFFMFNAVGETIEWVADDQGIVAAIIRYFLSSDGTEAQALMVKKVGYEGAPGCMVGVVDAAQEQANGAARGMAMLARAFDCGEDQAAILADTDSPVTGVSR